MKFWIFWGVDGLIALVFVCFFIVGLIDKSVSSANMILWLAILIILASVLVGSALLHAAGRTAPAWIIVLALAIPGLLAGLFFLVLIILNPRWN